MLFVNWCKKQNVEGISLAGGEPTLHPDFQNFVRLLCESNFKVSLFTNLLCFRERVDTLFLKGVVSILVNTDSPESYMSGQHDLFVSNLEYLSKVKERVSLGLTLRSPEQRADHILDYCKRFGFSKMRIDVARPALTKCNTHVKLSEIKKYRVGILDIIKAADDIGVKVHFDCPLPKCLFPDEDVREFDLNSRGYSDVTCGVLNVNPDLTVGICPYFMLIDKKITAFNSYDELLYEINDHQTVKSLLSCYSSEECIECEKRKSGKCDGYCLADRTVSGADQQKL